MPFRACRRRSPQARGRGAAAQRASLEQPREAAVLEHAPVGLAGRAVVDRVLLEVDPRERRAAARARLAELVVHAVGLRVVRRPRSAARARARARRGSRSRAARSPSASTCVESAYGESCADQRISFAHARPIPAISRWSRSSECSRRESDARMRATSSTVSVSASGPRCASSSVTCIGPQQPDAGALLRAGLGQLQLAAVDEPQAERRRLRALRAARDVLEPARAHQVHHHDELAVVGRQQEALRAALDAAEALAVERRERRVEGLERRDVRRTGFLDRRSLDEWVELAPPGFDLGQLRQLGSPRAWTRSG